MKQNRFSSGFTSFDVFRDTSDEIEFRIKCDKCKMSVMDIERSCISCDCDWFKDNFEYSEEIDE